MSWPFCFSASATNASGNAWTQSAECGEKNRICMNFETLPERQLCQPTLIDRPVVLDPVFDRFGVKLLELACIERGRTKQAHAVLEFEHQPITLDKGSSFVQAAGIFRENRPRRCGELDK